MGLYVAGLWRYPGKTLAGERLSTATVGATGIVGDRAIWVVGPEGVRTSRRHYRLLGLRGTLSGQGHVLINGYLWKSREALALVKRAAGDDAWLAASEGHSGFDVLPLLVATDGAVATFGRDVRPRWAGNAYFTPWIRNSSTAFNSGRPVWASTSRDRSKGLSHAGT